MASIQRYGDRWRVQVYVQGVRDSGIFETKTEAKAWGRTRDTELLQEHSGTAGDKKTLADACNRYIREISSTHKGHAWEVVRLTAMMADKELAATRLIGKITPSNLKSWQTARLAKVSPGTVLREISLMSAVFTAAEKDWGWIDSNPFNKVRKPSKPAHRQTIITQSEIRAMLRALGYTTGKRPQSFTQIIAYVFLFALHSGMRAGEIVGLEWPDVHSRWVTVRDSKNGDSRNVPLSAKAIRLIKTLKGLDRPFPIQSNTLDTLFRKTRDKRGFEFRFHDSRHTAATRIGNAGRISVIEMCKIFGWRDPKNALVYFNPTALQLAQKL